MNPARTAVVVGGGPAGLMAAEVLAAGGAIVHLHDGMPSVGRKFLLAGKGGLNLTHGEDFEAFVERFGARHAEVEAWLRRFTPRQLRDWAAGLGIDTFVGSSGRVFPKDMKSAPLLRAWLHRLRGQGVHFHMRQRWVGWASPAPPHTSLRLRFATAQGESTVAADAVVLALGGASWARLGSDGAWVPWLKERGIEVAPLRATNCGFEISRSGFEPQGLRSHRRGDADFDVGDDRDDCDDCDSINAGSGIDSTSDASDARKGGSAWSEHFASRFAGHALKSVGIELRSSKHVIWQRKGEFIVTPYGVEGSLIYAASARLRDTIAAEGSATLWLDLLPARNLDWVTAELARPRGARSMSTHLKSRLGLHGVKAGLLHELTDKALWADAPRLANSIKALPLKLTAPRPIDEAISTAGGVRLEALDAALMAHTLPGVFCAGEMLDWEAPTGGYLLSGCLASGRVAGQGAVEWLRQAQA